VIARRRVRCARSEREAGVSLIELVLAVTLTSIIMIPLGYTFYFGLHSTGDTQTRLFQSEKANIFATLFVPDVQNAVSAALNQSDSSSCGAASAQTANLFLTLTDGTTVSYYLVPGTGSNPGIMYRRPCNGSPRAVIKVFASVAPAQPNPFSCDTANCVNWKVVNATVKQQDAAGRNPYTTTLQANRRVT
jgi:hypothetical protein